MVPKRVEAMAMEVVVGVAGGENHSLVVTDEGGLFSFGSGGDGRLGLGEPTLQPPPSTLHPPPYILHHDTRHMTL